MEIVKKHLAKKAWRRSVRGALDRLIFETKIAALQEACQPEPDFATSLGLVLDNLLRRGEEYPLVLYTYFRNLGLGRKGLIDNLQVRIGIKRQELAGGLNKIRGKSKEEWCCKLPPPECLSILTSQAKAVYNAFILDIADRTDTMARKYGVDPPSLPLDDFLAAVASILSALSISKIFSKIAPSILPKLQLNAQWLHVLSLDVNKIIEQIMKGRKFNSTNPLLEANALLLSIEPLLMAIANEASSKSAVG